MFNDFVLNVQGLQGRRSGIKKEKFLKLVSDLNDEKFISGFESRDEARKALARKASGSLGIIGFFILKTVVYWIIDKILDYYFK
jgi:hypothetical protein